jgi:hypothetical protein
MTKPFWRGFEKQAEDDPSGHHVRRFVLGLPMSSALEAKGFGNKARVAITAGRHVASGSLKGGTVGGLGGGALGALLAAKHGVSPAMITAAAVVGATIGSQLGSSVGRLVAEQDDEASQIHSMYT